MPANARGERSDPAMRVALASKPPPVRSMATLPTVPAGSVIRFGSDIQMPCLREMEASQASCFSRVRSASTRSRAH